MPIFIFPDFATHLVQNSNPWLPSGSSIGNKSSPGRVSLLSFFVAFSNSHTRGSVPSSVRVCITSGPSLYKCLLYSSHRFFMTFSSMRTVPFLFSMLPGKGGGSAFSSCTCWDRPLLFFSFACSTKLLHMIRYFSLAGMLGGDVLKVETFWRCFSLYFSDSHSPCCHYKALVSIKISTRISSAARNAGLSHLLYDEIMVLIPFQAVWRCPGIFPSWMMLNLSAADPNLMVFAKIYHFVAFLVCLSDTVLFHHFFSS